MGGFLFRHRSALFELLAFVCVAVLVARLFDPWWSLLPSAVYLFFLSWAADRGKR